MPLTERVDHSRTIYRFKHLACNACRQRKLKCNGSRPVCKPCEKTERDCVWEDTLRKTGPRRGYVRSLETRLAEVESLLEQKESDGCNRGDSYAALDEDLVAPNVALEDTHWGGFPQNEQDCALHQATAGGSRALSGLSSESSSQNAWPSNDGSSGSWSLNAIGLQDPLPSQQAIDELHQVFFDKIYLKAPILHKGKYLAAMSLPATSRLRPPVCLSYTVWCLAASVSDDYSAVTEHFYHRARKYMDIDELASRGQGVVTLAHAQATAYLATYEARMLYFPRAWLSIGRAARLCHMMNLHRLDGAELEVREMLPTAMSWIELEERRRVFWAVFMQDRYQSIASGWPTILDERDIATNVPASEEEFAAGTPSCPSQSMQETMTPTGIQKVGLFAATVMVAGLFGRTLSHLHRKEIYEGDGMQSEDAFWKRHQYLDNVLLNTLRHLPAHLEIQACYLNPRAILLHINIQASTICLHQAAIFRSSTRQTRAWDLEKSQLRCLGAAETMMTILRVVDVGVVAQIGPWLPFCLYLSARVYVQALQQPGDPGQQSHQQSLHQLMGILRSMKARSPYTASLIMQLERDMTTCSKSNPIGHIMVPADEITETLEQDRPLKHSWWGTNEER